MSDAGKWRRLRRFGVFGDVPTRLMQWAARLAPPWIEPVVVGGWALIFYLLAGAQRSAVLSNLRAMFPEWSASRLWFGGFRVFWNVAQTYVDAARSEAGSGDMDWSIEGLVNFEELRSEPDGCLVLTAHTGNYDMAAPIFSEQFGRTVYAVRTMEREPELQKVRERELREKERQYPMFRSLYNTDGGMLGVELAKLLQQGNVVAVQGDRVVFEVSSMDVEVEPGLVMTLPRGPLVLARMSGARCFPLFILRDGWRRYRVQVLPEVQLPPRPRGQPDAEAAQVWAQALWAVLKRHWDQWFVFEPVLKRSGQ